MARFTATQILALGGKTWTPERGGTTRIYLNDWATLVGLEISHYKTGNISGATLNGHKLSNGRAYKLLLDSKVYLDTADGKTYFQGGVMEIKAAVMDAIATALLAIEEAAHIEDAERTAATATATAITVEHGDRVRNSAGVLGKVLEIGQRGGVAVVAVAFGAVLVWMRMAELVVA